MTNPGHTPARNWFVFGCDTEPGPLLPLRAGPLQMLYDPASGLVRRICLGDQEILRGIYAAVRDQNWGTVPATLRDTRRAVEADSFLIEFDRQHCQGGIQFDWHGTIRGRADGVIRYEFEGEAKSTFLRNRIGFCVLHPIRECAGIAARQTRVDGSVVESRFPEIIEPQIFGQSSFRDLRRIAHEVVPGLWAEVEFEGDVFEIEDQRNWTDASFKTYCTPLTLPFPVEIKAGTRIQQSVTLRLRGAVSSVADSRLEIVGESPEVVAVSVPDAPVVRLPRIGLGMATHGEALTKPEIDRLRVLQLAHLRADLRLSTPGWTTVLRRAAREAWELHAGLELAIHLPRDGSGNRSELPLFLQALPCRLIRVLALREGEAATTLETLRALRQTLAGVDVPIGAGSDANFCELNRAQALGCLAHTESDFLFWSMNPQVHAFDSLSIVEALEAQRDIVRTARAFAKGKPLVISPVTLKPRFNAVATSAPTTAAASDELPPPVDARQLSLFAAAWTLGSLAALAAEGAASVTLYETSGWRGIMERAGGSPLPDKFPSLPGGVFSVFHLLAGLSGGVRFAPTHVNLPLRVAALTIWDADGHRRLLLGNLTPQNQRIHSHPPTSAVVNRMFVLNADNIAAALREPNVFRAQAGERLMAHAGIMELNLTPHALAVLELD